MNIDIAEARAFSEQSLWSTPSTAVIRRLACRYDDALDELERLRARVTKLEAVVAALPKCQTWHEDLSVCGKIATRIGACDADPGYCCDGHKCRHACSELPYAAALRALDETGTLLAPSPMAVTPLADGWVEDALVAAGQHRRGRTGEDARVLLSATHSGIAGWIVDIGGQRVWISAASVPSRWPYRALEEQ